MSNNSPFAIPGWYHFFLVLLKCLGQSVESREGEPSCE